VSVGDGMDIERAIRQFRAAPPNGKPALYDQIAREILQRMPALRNRAEVGLSPKARAKLQRYDDGDLLARLIEQLVEIPAADEVNLVGQRRRRRTTYDPIDGKFDSYASDHIRRHIKSQMKPEWTALDKAPEVRAQPDRVPTNTLPMDEIHDALDNNVMKAMDSVTKADAKTKILYAIDQMTADAVSPANFDELCRQAGLSGAERKEVVRLTRDRPDKYVRRVEEILGISQSSARKRIDRAVPHLSQKVQDAMLEARKELQKLLDPPLDPNRDPFFNE